MSVFPLSQGVWVGSVAAVLACTAGAFGQSAAPPKPAPVTTITMPPTPLLPDRLGAMTAAHIVRTKAAEVGADTFDRPGCDVEAGTAPTIPVAGPCATILKEDGLVRLEAAEYGTASLKVQISAFEFIDATGAASAYSFLRSQLHAPRLAGPERAAKSTAETSIDAEATVSWAGTAVVKVRGHLPAADLQTLISGLPKIGGRKSLAPLLPSLLPASVGGAKLDAGRLRYALGPVGYAAMNGVLPPEILGWDKSAEIATSGYTARDGARGTLTLLLYPTPQIAADRGRAIEQAVNQRGAAAFGTVKLRRVGPLVGMASGGLPAEQADALVGALHLNEDLSFDKPMPLEFHAEVKKTATLLEGIAYFTATLIVAALVIGIFLGGARAGIRVLRGKPAAIEPEFLTINLRDSSRGQPLIVPKHPPANG